MISTYQRLKRRRDAGEINGFTLIELLIVIVVLGILAAVVIFALGGITGKSAVAACQADGATIETAVSAMNAQYPGVLAGASGAAAEEALLTGTSDGGPYLQSWPINGTHYAFALFGGTLLIQAPTAQTDTAPWTPTAVGTSITSPNGIAYAGPNSATAGCASTNVT